MLLRILPVLLLQKYEVLGMDRYRMFAASVPGAKYAAKGWECQDVSACKDLGQAQAIALADGHGCGDCFRSGIGARLAVETVLQLLQERVPEGRGENRFSETAIRSFKHDLRNRWRDAVREDWEQRLEATGELGKGEPRYHAVSRKYRERFLSPDKAVREKYLCTAYGTTLLCAVSIGTQILLLQIGDGTCAVLRADGEFATPIPAEEENMLNVTVSMCDEDADRKIRHAVLDCSDWDPASPVAVFLSSDGLDDCYPYDGNEEHLCRLYADILGSALSFGCEATETEILGELLPYMTTKASRDDISLAYIMDREEGLLRNALHNQLLLAGEDRKEGASSAQTCTERGREKENESYPVEAEGNDQPPSRLPARQEHSERLIA